MVDFSARENTGNTRLFLKDGEDNFFERPGGWCFNSSFSHQYWQHKWETWVPQNPLLPPWHIFIFFWFLGPNPWHMKVPRCPGWGSNRSYSCWPAPQPQPCQIQATSVTYSTAHVNVRSLAHWARPGIEPATSWFLVRFTSIAPW